MTTDATPATSTPATSNAEILRAVRKAMPRLYQQNRGTFADKTRRPYAKARVRIGMYELTAEDVVRENLYPLVASGGYPQADVTSDVQVDDRGNIRREYYRVPGGPYHVNVYDGHVVEFMFQYHEDEYPRRTWTTDMERDALSPVELVVGR